MKTKTKLLKTLTTLTSLLICNLSVRATFVEGPQHVYTNPTNDFVAMGFSTQTNANTVVNNYGIVSNINNAFAFGIATGTNSDTIRNYGTIGVIGANNGSSAGIVDGQGNGNFVYNYGSIYASAGPNGIISAGIACISSNNILDNRGLLKASAARGMGIVMNKSVIYNFGTIESGSNCIQEFHGGGSQILNGGTLSSANAPAINLRDDADLVFNAGTINTSHPNAIETHGGDDIVLIDINTPISGTIDGGNGTDSLRFAVINRTTADTRGNLIAIIPSLTPSGSITLNGKTFSWANFESFLALALADTASDFNKDGYNDLVLQSKTAVQFVAMSNNTATGSSPQNVKTLEKKDRIVSVNDFNFDMRPELVVANKSSVKVFTGTNFDTSFASLTLDKREKVVGAGNVNSTNIYAALITRKKKEIRYYPSNGTNIISSSTLLYTEKDGYKFIGAGRFGGGSAIVLKKKGKLEYRSITNLNATGTTISLPKGYKNVIGIADYADGGDMEIVAVKGKKVAIGNKAEAYTLPKKTKLVGPR